MEVLATAVVTGVGYLFSKNEGKKEPMKSNFKKVPSWDKPNGKNMYQQNRALKIRKAEQKAADCLYEKSKDSVNTNVMIPGPTTPIFNKTDYTDSKLPIEYRDSPYNVGQLSDQSHKTTAPFPTNAVKPDSGGWNGVPLTYTQGTSLTGNAIDPQNFKHNNMVPFFGGKVKQNVDQYANQTLLENFSGDQKNYQKKKEIKPMFTPQQNVGNPYGMSNLSGYNYDRYIVSNMRNNETPVEKIQVGPGLNKGYIAAPSGGIQQADTRDYVLPKKTNELRTKTNPKVSYYGRIVAGKHISKPGKVGNMQKNKPDTFYINTPDRYFTTVGACTGPKQRGRIAIKPTNRKTTGKRRHIGPAGPTVGTKAKVISKYRISRKQQYRNDSKRNASQPGTWGLGANRLPNDYGKQSMTNVRTRRVQTGPNKRVGAPKPVEGFKHSVPINPNIRQTRKQNVVGNTRWASNIQGPHNRGKVYDPNDIAKTTIKETNIHNTHTGNMGSSQMNKSTVYDPNDVTRTTIKETNIHNNHTGNMGSSQMNKSTVYDPNDVARTTIKETNIHNDHTGNMGSSQMNKGKVYDPNDIARTTVKETNIHNTHTSNINSSEVMKGKVYDPDQEAPTTMRECTVLEGYVGDAQMGNDGGYEIARPNAPNTNRQFTSNTEYVGDAQMGNEGGYQVSNPEAPNTNRQFTADKEYMGGANSGDRKATSHQAADNAVTRSHREKVAVGRTPGTQGPKNALSSSQIYATTNKMGDEDNERIGERGLAVSKVYNSLPQVQQCGVTKGGNRLPNKPIDDRLDPGMLDAYKKNPYTQSLHSFFFS